MKVNDGMLYPYLPNTSNGIKLDNGQLYESVYTGVTVIGIANLANEGTLIVSGTEILGSLDLTSNNEMTVSTETIVSGSVNLVETQTITQVELLKN